MVTYFLSRTRFKSKANRFSTVYIHRGVLIPKLQLLKLSLPMATSYETPYFIVLFSENS